MVLLEDNVILWYVGPSRYDYIKIKNLLTFYIDFKIEMHFDILINRYAKSCVGWRGSVCSSIEISVTA